jgi:hypothetical protein
VVQAAPTTNVHCRCCLFINYRICLFYYCFGIGKKLAMDGAFYPDDLVFRALLASETNSLLNRAQIDDNEKVCIDYGARDGDATRVEASATGLFTDISFVGMRDEAARGALSRNKPTAFWTGRLLFFVLFCFVVVSQRWRCLKFWLYVVCCW